MCHKKNPGACAQYFGVAVRDLYTPFLLSALLLGSSFYSYLLFHTLAEFFTVIVAILMFVVAWQMYPFTRNNFLMYLGCGYFWIGSLDMIHTLLYKGMAVYPGSSGNLSVQFWVGTRYLEAVLLLTSPFLLTRTLSRNRTFIIFGVIAAVIYILVMKGVFPDCFIEGRGLTRFKINSEYMIIGLFAAAIVHLWKKRFLVDIRIVRLLMLSMVLTMFAEAAFTSYASLYSISISLGHILKLFSFWLIFVAVIRTTLQEPFRAMDRGASTYDAVPDATIVVDKDCLIMKTNEKARQLSGKTEADLIGRHCHAIFHPSNIAAGECAVCRNIERGSPSGAIELKFPATGKWFVFSLSLIRGTTELRGMVQVMRDITDRRNAEKALAVYRDHLEEMVEKRTGELRKANALLEESNNELEAFSYSVSHDLRAPLRSIEGFSRALLEDHADGMDDEGKACIERVRKASRRMSHLIDDMLILSRISRINFRNTTVDLSSLAKEVASEMEHSHPERRVHFDIQQGLTAKGDPTMLRMTLENLFDNAWKFTGGITAPKVEFGMRKTDTGAAYFVRDNGVGFDMAYSHNLFRPFKRLHDEEEFPGTGIGLATVKRIINRFGGRVWAEGETGHGATFYFTTN